MAEDRPDLSRIDIKRLVERDAALRYVAHTNGGEYAGPCPFCGTGDDRFRVWPDHPDGRGRYWCRVCNRSGDVIDYLRERDRLTYPQALEELHLYDGISLPVLDQDSRSNTPEQLTPGEKPAASDQKSRPRYSRRETVARYTYVDEAGIPLYQVRRVHHYDEDGQRLDKQFYQYRWEDGQWQRGLKNTRRVIYRLPRVLAAVETGETIYIVEGEKSVHALETLGLVATCNPMGARKWKPDYGAHFGGAQVIILPDADEDGVEHAERVAASLIDAAESVKVVNLPGLDYTATHGLDVVDWLENPNHTLEALLALVEEAGRWRPPGVHGGLVDGIFPADVESAPDGDPFTCPALPAHLDFGSKDTGYDGIAPPGSWLDDYIRYAAQVSPMTPALFHESAGLWVASTAIARRLRLSMAFDDIYPNLQIGWVATSALFNKGTALNTARRLIWDAVPHLLAPEENTPQGLLKALAGQKPANQNEADSKLVELLKRWEKSRQYAAQKGWLVDELSDLLVNADRYSEPRLIDALLCLFDCLPVYRWSTGPSGYMEIRGAYLSLIGSSTPDALAEHLGDVRLWSNGWWAHFALLSPEENIPREYGKAVGAERPPALADKLIQLDRALPTGIWPNPPDYLNLIFDEEAYNLWEDYSKVMRYDLLVAAVQDETELDERLFGIYGRLPVQALKVAIILTALDWSGAGELRILLDHLRRALHIVERWRSSVHRTLRKVTSPDNER